MRLLDLFCGEGGASAGYVSAGFDVTGIDLTPMKRYPFEFIEGDALSFPLKFYKQFDAIAASPPCKVHTRLKAFSHAHHVDLVAKTRALLKRTGLPYIIENVPGSPLIDPTLLCGSMFGLFVRRHRLFETNWKLEPLACDHAKQERESPGFIRQESHSGKPIKHSSPVLIVCGHGSGNGSGEIDLWRREMQIPWGSQRGLAQAVPPAYTKYIGLQLIKELT